MTTIAYRDGVLAADSQVSSEGGTRLGERTKLMQVGEKLFGFAGDVNAVERASEWFEAIGHRRSMWSSYLFPPPPRPTLSEAALTVLEISAHGVRLYGLDLVAERLRAPFYAIGSGRDFALGAFAMGATAEEAVAAAIQFDVFSGGPIRTMTLARGG